MKLYLDLENLGYDNDQSWNITIDGGKGISCTSCSSSCYSCPTGCSSCRSCASCSSGSQNSPL